MRLNSITLYGATGVLALCGQLITPHRAFAQTVEAADQQGVEAMARGPVHEAFAAAVAYNPTAGIMVKKAPPAAIEERPPDQRPDGDNVAWIGGYWGWDEDIDDFLWISGVWRNLPPGRQWVPGYWNPLDDGYQWVSGYWADAAAQDVTYLPEPPATLEQGPGIDAPDDNSIWVPGNWSWYEERYAWSPGYWQPAQANWVWIPGHYIWTPRGYVYVSGYWDYEPLHRGVLFAPVRFSRYDFAPDYYYSPSLVVSLAFFSNHLFVRPGYCHYYYGDFYARRYHDRGYFASYAYGNSRRGYDPFFAHQRWQHRGDRNWSRGRELLFARLRDNENERPPRTLTALRSREATAITPLRQYVQNRKGEKFKTLDNSDRQRLIAQQQDVRKLRLERNKLEATAKVREGVRPARPDRASLLASPVIGKPANQFGKGGAPPKLPPARGGEPQKPDAVPSRRPVAPGPRVVPQPERNKLTDDAPRPNPRPQPKIVPRRTPQELEPREPRKVEPRPTPQRNPERNIIPVPERKAEPQPQPRPRPAVREIPRPTPQPAPRVTPVPERKAEPQPQPRPRPAAREMPRPTPQPAPRVIPRPAPRAESRPSPQRAPAAPRNNPGNEGSKRNAPAQR